MISLNLLPDIKKAYLRSLRIKRLVVSLSLLVSGTALLVVFVFGSYVLSQRKHISDLDKDIQTLNQELNEYDELAKVLTVQNQLTTLPELHKQKPDVGRLFDYLKVLVPNDVSLTSLEINLTDSSTMEIKGYGDDFVAVNKFADTLKNATYYYSDDVDQTEPDQAARPFDKVRLESISPEESQGDENKFNFKIELEFDPIIFDNTQKLFELKVPEIVSSPSTTERPRSEALFDAKPQEEATE